MRINTEKKRDLVFQFIFWISLFLFGFAKDYAENSQLTTFELFIYGIRYLIFQIIGAGFIYFVLIKKFFFLKKYLLFVIYLVAGLYTLSVACRLFTVYITEPLFANYSKEGLTEIFTDLEYLIFHYSFPLGTGIFIFISVTFMYQLKSEKEKADLLQKEKSELELKSLKAQLNPHFLFNTLNNIYSLSFEDSVKTRESLSRLADILDYILYKGQIDFVPVSEELKIIEDYIALESLRYDERLKITKTIELSSPNIIPPLIYLSLVENAFKHGAANPVGDIKIHIVLKTERGKSIFKIENSFNPHEKSIKEGIGLKNIREQVNLIYDNNYEFNIFENENTFIVEITTN